MILGVEIAMLIMGIYALIAGKLTLSKTKVVLGTKARLIGAIGLLPLPLSLVAGMIFGIIWAAQNRPMDNTFLGIATGIEAAIALGCFALIMILGFSLAGPPPETTRKKKKFVPDDDEDDDDDRPRKKSHARSDDDDEDEDERPRKKPRPRTDDDDEEAVSEKPLPKKRPRPADDDAGVSSKPLPKRRPPRNEDDEDDDVDVRKKRR